MKIPHDENFMDITKAVLPSSLISSLQAHVASGLASSRHHPSLVGVASPLTSTLRSKLVEALVTNSDMEIQESHYIP